MSSGTVQKVRTFKADLEAARKNSRAQTNEQDVNLPMSAPAVAQHNIDTNPVSPLQTKTKEKSVETTPLTDAGNVAQPLKPEPIPTTKPETTKPTPDTPATAPTQVMEIGEMVKAAEADNSDKPASIKTTKEFSPAHTEEEFAVDTEDLDTGISEGTIVSNKKVNRYGLLRALGDNFSAWKTKRQNKKEAREAAKPKISAAESRIETLKQAAKESYRAPQSDHGILLKQIKKRKPAEQTKATSNIVVKEKTEVPEPTWQHVVEEDALQQTKEKETMVRPDVASEPTDERKLSVTSEPTLTKPTSSEPVATPVAEETTTKQIPAYQWPPQKPATATAEQVTPEAAPVPVTTSPSDEQEEEKPVADEKPEKEIETETPTLTTDKEVAGSETAPDSDTPDITTKKAPEKPADNKMAFVFRLVIIIVFVIVAVGAVGGGVWYFLVPSTPTEYVDIATTPTQQLLRGDSDYTVSLGEGASSIYDTIYNHMVESRTLTTHTFLNSSNELAAPQTVVGTLGWRLPGSFARALTDITIGSIDGTEPFIILRATNFDTAFAGMLAWENTLSIDVSKLFGDPVVESFDPSARTDTGLRPAFYADAIVANTSVRILRDQNNTSRIIYGFANPNTIIITTDESAYQDLLDRVRN